MRQEHLLSVGADGGGYINLLCTNKDDISQSSFALWYAWGGIRVLYATFDLATARAGASRGVGRRRR